MTERNGSTSIHYYDEKYRNIRNVYADGSRVRLSYDERGNITELTDARGGTSRYTYDFLNRVAEATDAKGSNCQIICPELAIGD